jgi:phenylalanyl-tRNA synthetase beta subunit
MKISYNWLQEYFKDTLPNPKDLADLFNLRALEVEEIEEKDGDSIFEIKVTPNRAPDCLSHIGIAKEVALHTKCVMNPISIEDIHADFESKWNIEIQDNACVRYMAREVKGIFVGESPLELKLKLESIGQRSINTIVDITNLVMYELGQPMHAFDKDKLEGSIIKVASPINTHFVTLDNKDVELNADDITIQDATDNLAIAGVKGGKKAEVNSSTKNILLESANFFPVKVRKTSRRTGIQTDSSKRYENGLTPHLAQKALKLASLYIKKYASDSKTQFSNIIDVYPRPASPYHTGVSLEEINSKLGLSLSLDEVKSILNRLLFEFEYLNIKEFVVTESERLIGTPHKIAASLSYDAPRCFDCSTLTAYVYAHGGISIPRITVDQLFFGQEIEEKDLTPGDLIFSNRKEGDIWYESVDYLKGSKFEAGVDHVGIYMGNGYVVHSSRYTGKVVKELLSESDNFKYIVGYRRIVNDNEMRFAVRVPDERLDVKTGIDVIEEIGRVYGYEHIPPVSLNLPGYTQVSLYEKIVTIKSILLEEGFDEVITYSFGKKGDISVVKPLAKDKSYLRKNLSVGLGDALDLNFRNKELFAEDSVKIFEVGHVFEEDGEKVVLGIAVRSASKKIKPKDVLKSVITKLSEKLNYKIEVVVEDNQEVIEINLDKILKADFEISNNLYELPSVIYRPFSLYPFMTRDLAVWAGDNKGQDDIEKIIKTHAGDLLLRYDLFDQFSKDGRTSYAYRLIFQSFERTLTDEEINPIMDKIYTTLQADSNFEIR